MKISYRLTMMFISLAIILVIGRWNIGSFEFITGQFWFISGALLLIMLSLVDQPHFSKDANVFVNGATALVSLLTVAESQRFGLWWIFCGWAIYLIAASFTLMAIRSRELFLETKTVQFFSRLNRAIGRPESIFSAFFLGGIFLQFSYPKDGVVINYYQIIAANISETALAEGNASQCVRVVAGQLGLWNENKAIFSPIDWVAPAGEVVAVSRGEAFAETIPVGRCLVGNVPNSHFPVHVHISDAITHNTALIGVTGSGKSYLAFHLIEAYIAAGIKVLILDITRQHWQFLQNHNPTPLTDAQGVDAWLAGDSNLAIHQFANAASGFPKATADFAEKCFAWLQANTQLRAGVDTPARLCIVLEEAHSLIPEWNQVAQQSDTQQVNRAARVILQGRKFGLGTLLITQRTANVTKTILNQCNTIFALRSFDQTGLDFLRNYMGEEYSQAISTLPQFTAVLVGKASSSANPVILSVSNFDTRWAVVQPPPTPTSAA